MRVALLAVTSAIALSLSAAAYASQSASNEQTVSAAPDSEKIVCHYLPHEGSLIPRKYCATQYAWDKRRRDTQEDVREQQNRSLQIRPK
jgi:hypothetical protein